MDNQNTPTYTRLWHIEFLRLIIAEILLCTSCYMTIPFLPQFLASHTNADSNTTFCVMLLFVLGMCLSGVFSSWLIQRYRRNKVYLFSAIAFGVLLVSLAAMETNHIPTIKKDALMQAFMVASGLAGAAYGLAKRVLSCTLLIDKTESCHRTEANYAAISVARMAVAIGPVLYFTLKHSIPVLWYYTIATTFVIIATLLVATTKFPFRAPEECTKIVSTDRFFLLRGWKVFVGLSASAIIFGIIMYFNQSAVFFTPLLFGFMCATTTLCFPKIREWKHIPTIGFGVFAVSAIVISGMHLTIYQIVVSSAFIGFGLGIVCSCLLFDMLNLCQHCQRSTAESTYFLACDGGILYGIALACIMTTNKYNVTAIIIALLCLTFFTQIWKDKRTIKTKNNYDH